MFYIEVEGSVVTHLRYVNNRDGLDLDKGFLFDGGTPNAVFIKGKTPILMGDKDTKELWYEYEVFQPANKDLQKQKIQELENALLEMSALQAIKDIENEQAIMELTTMVSTMIGGMM